MAGLRLDNSSYEVQYEIRHGESRIYEYLV